MKGSLDKVTTLITGETSGETCLHCKKFVLLVWIVLLLNSRPHPLALTPRLHSDIKPTDRQAPEPLVFILTNVRRHFFLPVMQMFLSLLSHFTHSKSKYANIRANVHP